MNKIILLLLFFCSSTSAFSQDAKELHETAKTFLQQADYSNATLVLNKALQLEPKNIDIIKDLTLAYYFQKDYTKALEILKPIIETDEADDYCYQLAGDINLALNQFSDGEKMYKRGLKKFPNSGPLYNSWGELLWIQEDKTAIKKWEKGIEVDPTYSKNYYNTCKYYFSIKDNLWAILYGETFINLEPLNTRVAEVKSLLLESYKQLFISLETNKKKEKDDFGGAVIQCLNNQSDIARQQGISPETLTMIRTRFILDWYNRYNEKYPFRLFGLQRQLLQEGMFEAYNQWIFGASQNLAAYQNWIHVHEKEYNEFTRFQRGRIFKIPTGQYYHP